MRWSWRLARVNGAPVEVHWLFAPLLAYAGYIGWTQGGLPGLLYAAALLMATFGCILLHEVGHTLQAQAIGIPVRRIVLLPFGGLAQLAHVPDSPRDELSVALAGPLVNVGLVLIVGPLLWLCLAGGGAGLPSWQWLLFEVVRGQPVGLHFLASLTFVNASLLGLNALPAFPLDGGRILRSSLALVVPRAAATRVVARLGWLLGAACLLLATSAGRQWGEAIAITLLVTGLSAILGAGAEESFERGQTALKGVAVRAAVRQPTWCLQPADVLTPGLLHAIEWLNQPALAVMSDARLVGLLTSRELAAARARPGQLTAASLMRREFAQVEASSDLWRAQQIMLGADQEALPVLEGERLHGLLTSADIRAACVAPPLPFGDEAPQLISPISLTL